MHSPFPLFSPTALRELEARGTAQCDGDAFALMARAGQAAWRCVLKHWPRAMRIMVVCGPGNNGGDGYVLARHAAEAGREVRVLHLQAHAPAGVLAQRAYREYVEAGGGVEVFAGALCAADVLVDALFGIGLSRAPDMATAALIEAMNAHPAPVLALDVPSGIEARSGHAPGAAVRAEHTVQFIARHCGLRTGMALDACGALELATLELPSDLFDGVAPAALAYRADALATWFPLRPRDSHKGRNGHVLCIGGDHGSGGAIVLAAQAALRTGAGLVSVATRAEHVPAVLARCPEAMAHAAEESADVMMLLQRASVVAVGPGLGQGEWGKAVLGAAMASHKPCVIDADALNLWAQRDAT